jgi:hypothetical protein
MAEKRSPWPSNGTQSRAEASGKWGRIVYKVYISRLGNLNQDTNDVVKVGPQDLQPSGNRGAL